nr:hypothetical protein [Tanacetum cinerariifolium]
MAAAIGRAICNMPPTSFQDAIAATTNPLIRTLSGTGSSNYQDLYTMPPKIPTNNPLVRMLSDANSCANQDPFTTTAIPPQRAALSDTVRMDYHQGGITMTNKPLRYAFSDAVNYQEPPQKTRTPPPRVSSSKIATPESSLGKRSPHFEKMKKIEDMIKEIEQRCVDIITQDDQVQDENPIPKTEGQDECVGVERLKNGDLRFDLGCSCGKHFELLLKNNGYCFHRLT